MSFDGFSDGESYVGPGAGSNFLFSTWEQQCVDQVENDPDLTDGQNADRDFLQQNLYQHFQNSADSISGMYKEGLSGRMTWEKFQQAAGAATSLYKEGEASLRHMFEMGVEVGRRRRTRDVVRWVRAKRRHVRREDLLSFLADKPPPPRGVRRHHNTPSPPDPLTLQGLAGALSDVSVSVRPRTPSSPSLKGATRHHHHHHPFPLPPGEGAPAHQQLPPAARKRNASGMDFTVFDTGGLYKRAKYSPHRP